MLKKALILLSLVFSLQNTILFSQESHSWSKFIKNVGKVSQTSLLKTNVIPPHPILWAQFQWLQTDQKWSDTQEKIIIKWNSSGEPVSLEATIPSFLRGVSTDIIPYNHKAYFVTDLVTAREDFGGWFASRWVERNIILERAQGSSWINETKTFCSYDSATRKKTLLQQIYRQNQWIDYFTDTMIYDIAGHVIYNATQNKINSKWEISSLNSLKELKDSKGRTLCVEERRVDKKKYLKWLHNYLHDSSGKITSVVTLALDTLTQKMVRQDSMGGITWDIYNPDHLDPFYNTFPLIFNGNGISHFTGYEWQSNKWVKKTEVSWTYNPDHTIKYSISDEIGSSTTTTRSSFTYYSNADVKENIIENLVGSKWNLSSKEYNNNIYSLDGSILETISSHWNSNKYENYLKKNFIYDTKTAIEEPRSYQSMINFYPNPVSNRLCVHAGLPGKLFNIKIFNLSGQEISVPSILNGQDYNLDVSSLPSGMYILKMEIDGIRQVGKFLKE